jgi:predicted O-methyltransferase YrrM
MNRAKAVLELGTFTGYSALCFAEGLDNTTNPTVPLSIVTCDIDSSALHIAKRFIEKSKYSDIIEIRNNQAMDVIQSLIEEGRIFDM